MTANLKQRVPTIPDPRTREAARAVWESTYDRLSSQALGNAGLVIKAGGGVLVKNGTAIDVIAAGIPVRIAVNTDMAALSGTVTNAKYNVYCFYIDSAGTLTSAMGTEGATLAAVTWPATPKNKAMVGYVRVNPSGTGNFVGGTTALDDATVVPNAVYVNTQGAIDPTALTY